MTEGLRGSTSENCRDASRESVLEARIEESERQISRSRCVESYKYCWKSGLILFSHKLYSV